MNDFNRKNKIIGFKPYRNMLWRKIFLALSENDILQETVGNQTNKNKNQVDNTHKQKMQTRFMTEIIFIVVKTKRNQLRATDLA